MTPKIAEAMARNTLTTKFLNVPNIPEPSFTLSNSLTSNSNARLITAVRINPLNMVFAVATKLVTPILATVKACCHLFPVSRAAARSHMVISAALAF